MKLYDRISPMGWAFLACLAFWLLAVVAYLNT